MLINSKKRIKKKKDWGSPKLLSDRGFSDGIATTAIEQNKNNQLNKARIN
ncbi:MAG: hypothetical protein ACFBSE_08795 [Prochloraceae cyanobacterium]